MDELAIYTTGLSIAAIVFCCLITLIFSMDSSLDKRVDESKSSYNFRHPRRYSYGSPSRTSFLTLGAERKKRRDSLASPPKPSNDVIRAMLNKGISNPTMTDSQPNKPSLAEKIFGKRFTSREGVIIPVSRLGNFKRGNY